MEPAKIKRNSVILIGVLFYAYSSNFAYTISSNEKWHNPFLMNGVDSSGNVIVQDIYKAAYVDYASKALSWFVVILALCYILPEYREILFMSAFLFLGYLIEFCIVYNNPVNWYHLQIPFVNYNMPIPLGISTVAGVVFFIMLVSKLCE